MKQVLMFGFIACFWALNTNGEETVQAQDKSPKQVVEEFCKFETAGGRLTSSGWNKAAIWFVHPPVSPKRAVILVTDNKYSVWDPVRKGPNAALVIVGVTGDVWRLDSKMLVSRDLTSHGPKSGIAYKLIQTDKHWEIGADGKSLSEVTGKPEWRIEGTGDTIWLTKDTAIQYLTKSRDNTKDPVLKQNTDQAIAFLKRHLR